MSSRESDPLGTSLDLSRNEERERAARADSVQPGARQEELLRELAPAVRSGWDSSSRREFAEKIGAALAKSQAPLQEARSFAEHVLKLAERTASLSVDAERIRKPFETLSHLPNFLGDLCLAQLCARNPREEQAWALLSTLHVPRLVAQAAVIGCSQPEDEIHDLLMDLWLPGTRGHNLLSTYAGRAPLGPWLALVLRRRLAAARSTGAHLRALHFPDDDRSHCAPSAAEVVAVEETHAWMEELVTRALERLDPRDRELIESRYLRVESGKATARRMGVSPSFVSKRCRQVLELLRCRLRPILRREGSDAMEA